MPQQPDMPPQPRIVERAPRAPWHRSNGIMRVSISLGLTAAFGVFIVAAAVLYYRYVTVQPPTCSVWVMGNSALDGTTVTVSAPSLETPLRDTIRPATRFSARFFMNPGNYRIVITDKDGKTLFDDQVDLYPSFPFGVDLTRSKPETRPS